MSDTSDKENGGGGEKKHDDDDDDNPSEDSGGGDGDNDDDNLDDLLENLDIDNDFECWESFQKTSEGNGKEGQEEQGASSSDNVDNNTHPADDKAETSDKDDNNNDNDHDDAAIVHPPRPSSPNTVLQQDLQKWKERLEREEVYSRLYRPSQAERLELKELETVLNMNPKRGMIRTLFVRTNSSGGAGATPADRIAWNLLIHPEEQHHQHADAAAAAAAASNPFPSSILLKRGPVLYGHDNNEQQEAVEGEAILLTRGLILSKTGTSLSSSKKSVVSQTFDRAILWHNVTFVEPVAGDDMSWTLTVVQKANDHGAGAGDGATTTTTASNGESSTSSDDEHATKNHGEHHDDNKNNVQQQQHLTFVCASVAERDAWLDAMERVLIPHHLHNNNHHQNNGTTTTTTSTMISITELGWQYKVVHRPAFTMAVTGMVADMVLPPPDVLNQLDQYNELTPLHYAVRLDMTTSIRRLLDAGADPNVKDAEGRTCMYYAVRDELPSTTIALLEEYGAKESELAKTELRGELFGRVQATEQVRKDRRESQQRQEAVEAQVKMNENLRLLNERGEKIEDLGNKASELNANASNFASMAKQLKEKSKKQSKWLPFL